MNNYLNIMQLMIKFYYIYSDKNNYELYFPFNFGLLNIFNTFLCQIVNVIEYKIIYYIIFELLIWLQNT